MLMPLLMGSIPGIVLGSYLAPRIPEQGLRYLLAIVLMVVGISHLLRASRRPGASASSRWSRPWARPATPRSWAAAKDPKPGTLPVDQREQLTGLRCPFVVRRRRRRRSSWTAPPLNAASHAIWRGRQRRRRW